MIRAALLVAGFLLLTVQQFIQPIPVQLQFIFFLTGIVLIGVPHGAADMLVASKNSDDKKVFFSSLQFLTNYLVRLVLFAAVFWFFPLAANLMFVFFAAYHFGETDLHQFKTNTIAGKLFVASYGLVILGAILLNNFEEVMPLFQLFESGTKYAGFINLVDKNRYVILSFCGVLFFAATFFYFYFDVDNRFDKGQFLVQFALILIILYNLPMLLGFTFYFVVWHSVLSLKNIVGYLRIDGMFATARIAKQISIYSVIAMGGIVLFGIAGSMFFDNNKMMVSVFIGLAVLTAPHMQIMHNMYNSIRLHNTIAGRI